MVWSQHIPDDIQALYEIYDFNHAAAILSVEFPAEFNEILGVLRKFRIKTSDITAAGGNESNIPKLISSILRPMGWQEDKLRAEMVVDGQTIHADTIKVDYLKLAWRR
jgi:CRISPR-associated protein Csd2